MQKEAHGVDAPLDPWRLCRASPTLISSRLYALAVLPDHRFWLVCLGRWVLPPL
jgi:hypothetical protein